MIEGTLMMSKDAKVVRNRRICGGQPVIKGTRAPVRTILASLADGATVAEILADFPTLTEADIRAAIALAPEDR